MFQKRYNTLNTPGQPKNLSTKEAVGNFVSSSFYFHWNTINKISKSAFDLIDSQFQLLNVALRFRSTASEVKLSICLDK